jgi:putative (di)nucleoside polyphosphate hydrolase
MTAVSFGVLLLNERNEILLCHSTGNAWWDIPKGGADPGESPRESAVRETFEECGVQLDPAELVELGLMRYYAGKDLHLFVAHRTSEQLDPANCRCTSFFENPRRGGRRTPEVDDFRWVPFSGIQAHCTKNMAKVLTTQADLPALAKRPD